jgi:hypothetical protein
VVYPENITLVDSTTNEDSGVWKVNILVTGGAGHIGSYTEDALESVRPYARYPSQSLVRVQMGAPLREIPAESSEWLW